MNPSTIEIHEFSTGIRPQKTADGGWVSLGFTGQYMNVTIECIPDAVERSIANREFAVAEGASSDQPAIIGRVVGTPEDTWSVLAVVTRGRDEKGRSASMYRYFLCQGSEGFKNLRLILAWWENQEIPPKFHPFDAREIGKPNICNLDVASTNFRSPPQEAITIPVNMPEPILLPPEQQYDLQTLNTLASKKYNVNKNGQALSWAFNVEALEKPERFQVIQAASIRAYQILQKAITNTPKVLAPVLTDEEALKSAIRGLMNSSQVKRETVKVIADALENDQITSEYWHTLFDGQGAKTAISQKIYSPQMVRLITLRAMVIAETVLEFLAWLNIKAGQQPDQNQTISLELQKAIRSDLPKDKLANSIKFLLPKMLNQPQQITPEAIHWLLAMNGSAWVSCRQEIIKDIFADLELIYNHFKSPPIKSSFPVKSLKCEFETWEKFIAHWKLIHHSYHKLERYHPLAKLLEQLQQPSSSSILSAYFYQVSEGIVPRELFEKVVSQEKTTIIFGLSLEREVTFLESGIDFLTQRCIVPIQIVIPLSIIFFMSGLFIGSNFLIKQTSDNETVHDEEPQVKGTRGYLDETYPKNVINAPITASDKQDIIKDAIKKNNFDKTTNTINQIVIKIRQNNPEIKDDQIIEEINNILNIKANYKNALNNKSDERKKIAEAIYDYQVSQSSDKPDGYLSETIIDSLTKKVQNNLKYKHSK